jgi:hypothetical protein
MKFHFLSKVLGLVSILALSIGAQASIKEDCIIATDNSYAQQFLLEAGYKVVARKFPAHIDLAVFYQRESTGNHCGLLCHSSQTGTTSIQLKSRYENLVLFEKTKSVSNDNVTLFDHGTAYKSLDWEEMTIENLTAMDKALRKIKYECGN